jgi:hypothetical protein
LRQKYLWSAGGENTIIYDHIVHWVIDLQPQRSLFRWERRCSVPLRSTAHLRIGITFDVVQRMGAGQWNIGIPLKYLIIAVCSFIIIMALYEGLVRHFNWVRFLFGMRPKKKV